MTSTPRPPRGFPHRLDEVLLAVVDCQVGPQRGARSALLGGAAVAKPRAPRSFASGIAAVPMPLDPPCTRNVSPAREAPPLEDVGPHRHVRLGQGGSVPQADRRRDRQALRRRHQAVLRVGAAGDDGAHLVTDPNVRNVPPAATTVPETSSPGMSDAPAAADSAPSRCITSARLTPAAATRTSTSPGPGRGVGRAAGRSASGGPGSLILDGGHRLGQRHGRRHNARV